MKLIVVQILSRLYFIVPFHPTHLSHHLILEHPQLIFFPECERYDFPLTSNNRHVCIYVCFG